LFSFFLRIFLRDIYFLSNKHKGRRKEKEKKEKNKKEKVDYHYVSIPEATFNTK